MTTLNIKKLESEMKNWFVEYNTYSDLFQIFDIAVFKQDRRELVEEKINNIRLIYSKNERKPLLLEITGIYDMLGVNIDKISKSDIIKLVKPYIKKWHHNN